MLADLLYRASVWLGRKRLVSEHGAAIKAYEDAKRRKDKRGQRAAFDRLRGVTNQRLRLGL